MQRQTQINPKSSILCLNKLPSDVEIPYIGEVPEQLHETYIKLFSIAVFSQTLEEKESQEGDIQKELSMQSHCTFHPSVFHIENRILNNLNNNEIDYMGEVERAKTETAGNSTIRISRNDNVLSKLLVNHDCYAKNEQAYQKRHRIIDTLTRLIGDFELNSKFLYESNIVIRSASSSSFGDYNERPLSFVSYLVDEIYSTFSALSALHSQIKQIKESIHSYQESLKKLYYLIIQKNTPSLKQLHCITQKLTRFYYSGVTFKNQFMSIEDQEQEENQREMERAKKKLMTKEEKMENKSHDSQEGSAAVVRNKSALTANLIETSFRLLEAALQERVIQPFLYFSRKNKNSLGFESLSKTKEEDAINLIFHNPKWIFNKGMTLWIWLKSSMKQHSHRQDPESQKEQRKENQNLHSPNEDSYPGCTLLSLRTDQKHRLEIKLLSNYDMEIVIVNGNDDRVASLPLVWKIPQKEHKIVPDELILLGVELDAQETSTGFFGKPSNLYTLKIKCNNNSISTTLLPSPSDLPKFAPSDQITSFSLLDQFIGSIYSIILTNKSELLTAHNKLSPTCAYHSEPYSSFYGPCNQKYAWALINSNILQKQNIVAIFNAERVVENSILVNYVGFKSVIGCFVGQVSKDRYMGLDSDDMAEVLMPYLYMLVLQKQQQLNSQSERYDKQNVPQEGKQGLSLQTPEIIKIEVSDSHISEFPMFDLIVKQIVKIAFSSEPDAQNKKDLGVSTLSVRSNDQDNQQGQGSCVRSTQKNCENILFILYFLELANYPISQPTLNYLLEEIAEKTQIVTSMKNEEKTVFNERSAYGILGKFLNVPLLIQKGLKIPTQVEGTFSVDYDPVEKIQLMFYLETKWKQKWCKNYQGFYSWWSNEQFLENIERNNVRFRERSFKYSKVKSLASHEEKNPSQSTKKCKLQWSVKNFITNDFCKCILEPLFYIPQEYHKLHEKYQKEYISKQCMLEPFRLQLRWSKRIGSFSKVSIKKYSNLSTTDKIGGTFNRVKRKLLGGDESKGSNPKTRRFSQHKSQIASTQSESKIVFETESLLIELLSVIITYVTVSSSGTIILSSHHSSKEFDHMCVKAFDNQELVYHCFNVKEVKYARKRRYNQSNNTVEIRMLDGNIYLLHFFNKNISKFLSTLVSIGVESRKESYEFYLDSKEPEKWIEKKMSNFEYILWLNDAAGRNFLDIAQYPVLPWVYVQDKEKEEKKQNAFFRDLLKNMGSQGDKERVNHFLEKYSSNNEQELFNEYHFGTHYSSSAIIFNYMIRVRPFSVGALTLQSGKFDCADRIFGSYIGSWLNATNSQTDIRQLIPQVYTLPQMFLNINNYDFGTTQEKSRIDNVELPKWCHQDPYKFICGLRKNLESPYTSKNINNWIDLIFGFKQRGEEAIKHMNIFFPLTYEDAINLENIESKEEKLSFETQIAHFGQNPSQIIGNNPHPKRIVNKQAKDKSKTEEPNRLLINKWEGRLIADGGKEIKIQKCSLVTPVNSNSSQKNHESKLNAQKFIYKSPFQSFNAIMCIKFLSSNNFIVVKKHEYQIFKIENKKNHFISKEIDIKYELESTEVSLNYNQILMGSSSIPVTNIGANLVVIGGFYNHFLHFIFTEEPKCNQSVKFMPETVSNYKRAYKTYENSSSTITALQFCPQTQMLYIGDNQGYFQVYKILVVNSQHFNSLTANKNTNNMNQNGQATFNSTSSKQLQFAIISSTKLHNEKINQIHVNHTASLCLTCSDDGTVKILNLFSHELIRLFENPCLMESNNNSLGRKKQSCEKWRSSSALRPIGSAPIASVQLSRSPLYSVQFYSPNNHTIYSYSINGQFLEERNIVSLRNASQPVSHGDSPVKQPKIGVIDDSPAIQNCSHGLHGLFTMPSSDTTQNTVYLTHSRELNIVQLPFMEKTLRKIKLKKTDSEGKVFTNNSITCFTADQETGRMCLIGNENGNVQIIADPESY